jgi:thiamine biosynthesis lipoprotein
MALLVLAVLLFSCTKQPARIAISGEAQGTYFKVTYYDSLNRDYSEAIDSLLKAFDQSVSLWVDSSIISRVNGNDTSVRTDSVFREVFRKSNEIAIATQGMFNPAVGPLVKAWGFHRKQGKLPSDETISEILPHLDFRSVRLAGDRVIKSDTALKLDFNGIAQGYSVDLVGRFLRSKGIRMFLVDIGGEILAGDRKPDGSAWRVGIEKPAETADAGRELTAMIEIVNQAVATSGNYRKYRIENGKKLSHTINPLTGYPVDHDLLSVSVLADDAITADGYATAFMAMGSKESWWFIRDNRIRHLEACFIVTKETEGYHTIMTEGFSAKLKTEE